ncbi:hypothetical protein DSECCO2_283180 [anaerobic digester metagenome]
MSLPKFGVQKISEHQYLILENLQDCHSDKVGNSLRFLNHLALFQLHLHPDNKMKIR